jgi:hypothetical protein
MAAWAAVLPLLKHLVPLETLARVMWSAPVTSRKPEADKIVALSRALTRRPPRARGRCYEQSLLAYRFLSKHGADPRLVAAVRKEGRSMVGHAWVTVDGVPVGEAETIDDFVPLAVYGRGGRLEE